MADEPVEPRIVAATGVAVGLHADKSAASERIEAAMSEAAQKAHDEGITDPEEIKARMMAAREAALNG